MKWAFNETDCKEKWAFNETDYMKHQRSFWPMPNQFVTDGHLARLWSDPLVAASYSSAAVSILPAIGMYMNTVPGGRRFMSQDQMAVLAGISVNSVRKAARLLTTTGLGKMEIDETPNGLPVSVWSIYEPAFLTMELRTESSNPGHTPTGEEGYFSFPGTALYGGYWSRLTGVQKAVYLAIAAKARTYKREPAEHLLRMVVTQGTADLILKHSGRIQLAFVSNTDVAGLTGISRSSVVEAIRSFPLGCSSMCHRFKTRGNGKSLFLISDHLPWSGLYPLGKSDAELAAYERAEFEVDYD
jgi:hypothetical protein